MTLPMTSKTYPEHIEEAIAVEQIKRKARERKLQEVRSLAGRMQIAPDGSRYFVRFSRSQCFEHQILMVSFTTLAVTGLLQSFSNFSLVGFTIQFLGGVETIRIVHRLAAVLLILQSIYHVGQILVTWFVKREQGGMWPSVRDFRNLFQAVMFNLGLKKQRPEFDRFTIEEKLEYWAMLWGTPIMIVTGLILWFPVLFTAVFPGKIVPIALTIHAWEAILATLAILTWHMYNVVIKEKNRSIFTGMMSEEEMQHSHPLEYRRILAAYEYLQKVVSYGDDGRQDDPVTLKVALKEASRE